MYNSYSPPPAPDYTAAAEAQGRSSLEAIDRQTQANRVDQNNPFGNMTWETTGGLRQSDYDAAMQRHYDSWEPETTETIGGGGAWVSGGGDSGDVWDPTAGSQTVTKGGYYKLAEPNKEDFTDPVKWTQNVTLNPELQAALDAQIATQRGRSEIAAGLMPQVEEAITNPLDWDSFQEFGATPTQSNFSTMNESPSMISGLNTGQLYDVGEFNARNLPQVGQLTKDGIPGMPTYDGQFVQDIQNQALNFMAADQDQQRVALESRLAAQGATPGSAAYNNAMRQFNDQQARDKYQALNVAMNQAQGMFNSGLAANAQGFGQNRDIFNSQLAANQNAFGQQNQSWQNNYNLDSQQFGQRLAETNFVNNALSRENDMRLANRGFNNTVADNQFRQQQAIADYQNNLRIQQIQEAQMRQLQPLNNLNALLTGQQVGNPQFNSFNTAGAAQPTNYLGAANMLGNYNMQQAQMQNASDNSFLNGLTNLTGQGIGAYMAFSDRKLKTGIKKIGKLGRFNLYRYRYVGSDVDQVGVMADEVKKIMPEAVVRHRNGYDMVNYSMIGA